MRASVDWLREFAPLPTDTEALADAANSLGLIVDGVERGPQLDGVVVAEVRNVRAHPNADRIRLCDVVTADDQAETLQVACGAWNFEAGARVALATLGTTLPGGLTIERRQLRGEWSNGMLCSLRELGLGDDHGGIALLPADAPLGAPVTQVLGSGDAVLDLGIEANRPDAMSIVGIARDLAARFGVAFTLPDIAVDLAAHAGAGDAPGSIAAPDLCDRLTVTVLRHVVVCPSPPHIAARLEQAGMRPISNVVDASNYVMLELGAPSHAFDLDRLAGGRIGVRWCRPGERLVTLDGQDRALGAEPLDPEGVIVDGNDVPVGIAAVMGGASTEVHDGTTSVLLEVAHWAPMAIARTSKRLNLRSEASARYERNSDAEVLPRAAARVIELLRLTCPDLTVERYDDLRPGGAPAPRVLALRPSRANLLLGTALDPAEMARLLSTTGFVVADAGGAPHGAPLTVTVPSWRTDVEAEVNLIEEVGRLHGYDNIPRVLPTSPLVGKLTDDQRDRRRVRTMVCAQGIDEAWTPTFVSDDDLAATRLAGSPMFTTVRLANPMTPDEVVLRPSLLPGLLRAVRFNTNRRQPAVRLFEIGHVFGEPRPRQVVPYEREHLSAVLCGDGDDARTAQRLLDVLTEGLRIAPAALSLEMRDALPGLHPTRTAFVVAAATNTPIGTVGEVDPAVAAAFGIERRVGWLDVDLENLLHLARRPTTAQAVPAYPSSDVDLSFVVHDDVATTAVTDALRRGGGAPLVDLRLFDVHRSERLGAGRRGLTYRLRLQSGERTLTDADVAAVRQSCIDAAAATGATLRA